MLTYLCLLYFLIIVLTKHLLVTHICIIYRILIYPASLWHPHLYYFVIGPSPSPPAAMTSCCKKKTPAISSTALHPTGELHSLGKEKKGERRKKDKKEKRIFKTSKD